MDYPIRPALPLAHADLQAIQDTVVVGDGLVGKMQSAAIMNRIQKLPASLRRQAASERNKFMLTMIGSGDGRAFQLGRGHSGSACVNLRRDQMSYRAGNTAPADDALLKLSPDLEDLRLNGQKPIAFAEPYISADTGRNYALLKQKDESFSLQHFVQKYYPAKAKAKAKAEAADTERFIVHQYGHYFLHREAAQTPDVNFKQVDGQVTAVDYDAEQDLFHLAVSDPAGGPEQHVFARHVVMATGLEGDLVPECMRQIAAMPIFSPASGSTAILQPGLMARPSLRRRSMHCAASRACWWAPA